MMIGEVTLMNEWIPEQMQPGTMFVLENAGQIGEQDPSVTPGRLAQRHAVAIRVRWNTAREKIPMMRKARCRNAMVNVAHH